MKNIVIIILIMIILGLYFYTSSTKEILKTTGNAILSKVKEIYNEARDKKVKETGEQVGQWQTGIQP